MFSSSFSSSAERILGGSELLASAFEYQVKCVTRLA